MRAILINPNDCTVSEVEYTGEYSNIYDHINAENFDAVMIGDDQQHTIFVDDEGLLQDSPNFFRFDGDNPAYLAGKALILATDDEGESVAATMTLDHVRERVAFGVPLRGGQHMSFAEWDGRNTTGRVWTIHD